uniref:Lysosomal Pro-X carboxypeptidase n=1 Tax=Dunaliella tertiolecta TaxID=3047 RepID=A0A7S3VQE0_DUNTE|mmetsp:Transcript_12414/g.33859  ORF Transcript_12414/g.33859 Transcript_12414/m.33859 type:complete len:563 (-) Transcript_12414:388-2076(-)
MQTCLVLLSFLLSPIVSSVAIPTRKRISQQPVLQETLNRSLLSQCTEHWAVRTLDHFNWEPPALCAPTYQQRYYVCGKQYWKPNDLGDPGPIFLYAGNEADVLLYLNNSGLMWENAPKFGALLVFAEHRYYGKSMPSCSTKNNPRNLQYLTAEQAMADYTELIWELKHSLNATSSPVIAFGGSYGGMLAAWMRMKYPATIDGAIAASAPIWNFEGEDPPFDPTSFAKGVSYDASPEGGSAPACISNARAGFKLMEDMGSTVEGRADLKASMRLCPSADLFSKDNVTSFREWVAGAWDSMAMGNFPFKSGYILNGHGELPAFPVRVACEHLADPQLSGRRLLEGMAMAAGVFYNYSGSLQCFDYNEGANKETAEVEDLWDYQYCTEMFMPFGKNGVADMFWPEPWDPEAATAACKEQWGVTPRRLWATEEWGGKKIGSASRIAFSNGLLDPWHGGGVLQDIGNELHAIIIPEGAHHLDLMFSRPDDGEGVRSARLQQQHLIAAWIAAARAEGKPQLQGSPATHKAGTSDTSTLPKEASVSVFIHEKIDGKMQRIKAPRKLGVQ